MDGLSLQWIKKTNEPLHYLISITPSIMKRLIQLSLFLTFLPSLILAQAKGKISGTVVDASTGETLVGVNVVIEGTFIGKPTDLDGKYIIDIEPGTYTLVASYVSYNRKRVLDVVVEAGKTTTVDFTLESESKSLGEITVSADANKNTEAALLRVQFKAPSIMDGISSEQIKRTPDASSSDALKRVTGVTITGGKFVNVRGTPERYSVTMLNGSQAPSTEADKRSFSFDLVPSNLLDNVIIIKAATPDIPGDFSGGMVKLSTIDFPTDLTFNFSYGTAYKTGTTFGDFLTYPGGNKDFLGIDDGSRKTPAGFPSSMEPGMYSREQINNFAKLLGNVWDPSKKTAPADQNISLSVGNSFGKEGQFGAIASLSYRNSYQTSQLIRREFEAADFLRFDYKGSRYQNTVLWGGILNLSWKPNTTNKVSLKNTITTNGEDEVTRLEGGQFTDRNADQLQNVLRFTSRNIITSDLSGEHFFSKTKTGLNLRWNVYNTLSNRDEPDYRRSIYERPFDTDQYYAAVGVQANVRNGGRYYSDLKEQIRGGSFDLSQKLGTSKITLGGAYDANQRDFNARLIGVIQNASGNGFTDFNLLFLPLNQIFAPENFRRNGFSIQEFRNGSNTYDANQQIAAAFLMIDSPFSVLGNDFRFVGGLRLEDSKQAVNTLNVNFTDSLKIRNNESSYLPSANLTWLLSETSNLRFAASKTVNRPELRELAPFSYFDYNTQTSLRGNENLKQSNIQNLDIRYELYPTQGELIALSVFYKSLNNAIEQVIVSGVALNAERTYSNADKAQNYGFEIEGRKNLGFISESLRNTLLSANYTRVKSSVEVKSTDSTLPREGKPLQGQSAYSINLGLNYNLPISNTNIGLFYNRLGSRIVEVATNFEDDVIEDPRDLLDLTISQPLFGGRYEMKFSARNMLNQDQIFRQANAVVRQTQEPTSFSIGLSIKL
jgi:outer membrane receptor protein involved in Fe transport